MNKSQVQKRDNMHILDSFFLGLLACLLINIPLIFRAFRLRHLSRAKLEITKCVVAFEQNMLDGTLTRGDLCHDVLFRGLSHVQNREIYAANWIPFRIPSANELKMHEMLECELRSNDAVAESLRSFSHWHSRAFMAQKPLQAFLLFCWILWWKAGFKLLFLGLLGLALSILGVRRMLSNYRRLKDLLDELVLARSLSASKV